MKALLIALAAVASVAAIVFAVLYFTTEPATKRVVVEPCGDRVFGHIESLERKGDQFVLRFDPAWFTSGVTANTAAAEDGVVEPGEPVPNDNYVVDESHRLVHVPRPRRHTMSPSSRGAAIRPSSARRRSPSLNSLNS